MDQRRVAVGRLVQDRGLSGGGMVCPAANRGAMYDAGAEAGDPSASRILYDALGLL